MLSRLWSLPKIACQSAVRKLDLFYGMLTPIVKSFEESPFVRLFAIAAILFFPLQYWADREERHAVANSRAWERLTTPSTGNSGKIQAIEYLVHQGIPLPELDMSCKSQSLLSTKDKCSSGVYLRGLDVSVKSRKKMALLERSNFTGANLRESNLSNADLSLVTFDDASLLNATVVDSFLVLATFEDTFLQLADFRYSDLSSADFSSSKEIGTVRFWGSNLSSTVFPANYSGSLPHGFYYVDGYPPIGISVEHLYHYVCGSSLWPHGNSHQKIEETCEAHNKPKYIK